MNTLVFAGGVLLGALATFVFVFITISLSVRKEKNEDQGIDYILKIWETNPEMILDLAERIAKRTKDDGS